MSGSPPRAEELEARVEALETALRGVCARLERLELRTQAGAARRPSAPLASEPRNGPATAEAAAPAAARERPLALAGRTLLALAGAYLIRALTDDGLLPPRAGVVAGLGYGLAWTLVAARSASRGLRLGAQFHSLAGALVLYPLLVETGVRLGWLPPPAALLASVLACGAALVVAARYALLVPAWLHLAMAAGTCFAVLVGTHRLLEPAASLVALALLVEALALSRLAGALRWPAALAADLATLLLAGLLGRAAGLPPSYAAVSPGQGVAACLALALVYLVSIAVRTLGRGTPAGAFEVVQGAAAVLVGFGGAARVLAAHGGSAWLLGGAALALGLACYAVAFAFVARREAHGANFHFYSNSGLLLLALGSAGLFPASGRVLAWSAFALAAAALARRHDRVTLRSHAAVLLLAAALGHEDGLARLAADAFLGRGAAAAPSAAAALALAAALGAYALLATVSGAARGERVPLALIAALATFGTAGAAVQLVRLAGLAGSPHALAALRTLALAALAVALAEAAGRLRRPELGVLVYPVLALGGLKLLLEDLPAGRPAALVASFVVYGGALILAPRRLNPER